MSRFVNALIACANRTPLAIGVYLTSVLASALGVSRVEQWGFGDSVWWAFTTTTTVGYGDLSPATVPGRVIAVLTMFAGIIGIGVIVGRIAAVVIRTHDDFTHEEQEELAADVDEQLQLLRQIQRDLRTATGTRGPASGSSRARG